MIEPITKIIVEIAGTSNIQIFRNGCYNRYRPTQNTFNKFCKVVAKDINHINPSKRPYVTLHSWGYTLEW